MNKTQLNSRGYLINETMDMKRLEKLLKAVNIRVHFNDDLVEDVCYVYRDKKRIVYVGGIKWVDLFGVKGKRDFLRLVTHEIGHFLVASPHRRKRSDYGIPDNSLGKSPEYKWLKEDQKACLIQFDLCDYVGVHPSHPVALRKEYRKEHKEWYESTGKVISETVINLAKSL